MVRPSASRLGRYIAPWVALSGLALLVYMVMSPFWGPITWAGILAYTTWPMLLWLRRRCGGRESLAALAGTLLVAVILLAPLFSLVWLAQQELAAALAALRHFIAHPPELPSTLRGIPWLGDWLALQRELWLADPNGVVSALKYWLAAHVGEAAELAGGLGRQLVEMLLMVLILFFFYQDGQRMVQQLRHVLTHFIGRRVHSYLAAAAATTRAVVYGIFFTALVQGSVAGLGYWVAGTPSPVVLTIVTTVFALIPFGTPLVWGSVGAWLAFQGETGAAIGIWLWGAAVVSQLDNVVRPIFISRVGAIPFLLVLFGIFGGILAFGFIGLFVGPIILAVAWAVWREWASQLTGQTEAE